MAENKKVELDDEQLDGVSGGCWQIQRYYILDCKCSCGGRVYSERRAADGSNSTRGICNVCGSVYHMDVLCPTHNLDEAIYEVTKESGTGTIVENNCRWVNK